VLLVVETHSLPTGNNAEQPTQRRTKQVPERCYKPYNGTKTEGEPAGSGELYRTIRADENPEGIVAKNTSVDYNVNFHVSCGSFNTTQYVSTTSNKEVTFDWACKGNPPNRICTINRASLEGNCEVFDLTTDEGREKHLQGPALDLAKDSEEVVLLCQKPFACESWDIPTCAAQSVFANLKLYAFSLTVVLTYLRCIY